MQPIGVFKGGEHVNTIDISQLAANPATALYIKSTVLTTVGTPPKKKSHGGGTNVLWIVLPTVLGVTLVTVMAVAWATLLMRKQTRKEQAATAAAAAAATRPKQRQVVVVRAKPPGVGGGPPAAAPPSGGGAPASAPASGSSPFASLSVRLLKASPPPSGSSCEDKGSPHGSAASYGSCVTGVPCPNCGATLGISCRHMQPPSSQLEQLQPLPPQGLLLPAPPPPQLAMPQWQQLPQQQSAPTPVAAAATGAGSYIVDARHVVPQHAAAVLPQGHLVVRQQ